MRKNVVLAACIALPFVTAVVANLVTPGYPLVGHTSTLIIALIVGFAALFAFSLNMRDSGSGAEGWPLAAGWTVAVAILIVTMMETVILKPRGVDGRQWLPTMTLAALAIATCCEREGGRAGRDLLLRALAMTALAAGAALGLSLAIAAAAGRMSGDDLVTISLAIFLSIPLFGAFVQTQRAANRSRARLGAACALFVLFIVVTSEGTYQWTPHYSPDAAGRQVFQ
jgi:hypothetical protein